MLQSTFVLLNGVGPYTERRLWDIGITDWHTFMASPSLPGITAQRKTSYDAVLSQALAELRAGQSRYFSTCLKPRDHWRLFGTFKSRALYLDIETTGEPPNEGEITVVGLYRDREMVSLVQGDGLTEHRLNQEFARSDLLVTFFGSVFDLPYLRAKFPGLRREPPHFDLCFAARRLGLTGGLKRIEAVMDIHRAGDIQGLDGWEAVRLWNAWRSGEAASLHRLLRYNEADTRNLEPLAELMFRRLTERYGPTWDDPHLSAVEHR